MRNFFLFVWKNHFIFLFLLIEALCIYLLIQNNNYQQASFVNSTNNVVGNIMDAYSNVTDYFSLRNANEQLANENAKLHKQNKNAFYKYTYEAFEINDTIFEQRYVYIPAKVINNSVNKRNNYLTLNRGSKQGIKRGMGVICPQGYVGIIKDVSEHFSTVQSFLHKLSTVSAKLSSTNYVGALEWSVGEVEYGELKNIPGHVNLHEGDTVITTEFSAVFPEGVMLGVIEKFKLNQSTNFYDISIKLSTDYRNLDYVYVVNNLLKAEQLELEEKTEEENAQ